MGNNLVRMSSSVNSVAYRAQVNIVGLSMSVNSPEMVDVARPGKGETAQNLLYTADHRATYLRSPPPPPSGK